jgi:hypothetical protein
VTRVVVQCDGARVPEAEAPAPTAVLKTVNSRGSATNLNLRAQSLAGTVLTGVADRAADLVRIASYVYAADQLVSRGGPADVYGERWKRQILMCVPVTDPGFWTADPVREALVAALGFLTDDVWSFEFCPADPEAHQLPLDLLDVSDRQLLGEPDSVALLSGGADSLCAVLEAVALWDKRPVIVSHRPAPNLDARQKGLVDELARRFPRWGFPHLSFAVHRMGSEAAENSQRSRAFLYASLGAAVAAELGVREVLLADNGVVSLNLPISAQLVGATASRGTHPKFLARFNDFAAAVLPGAPRLTNPLWSRTRAEGLHVLKQTGCEEILQETLSCSRSRGRPKAVPQCGYCSQCVDRRFAAIAAGLEDVDLAERYEVDVFRDALALGEARTVAESYVRFARDLQETPDEALFERFPQLYDCLLSDEPDQLRTAEALCALLRRHAQTTLGVMSAVVRRYSAELVAHDLAPDSLVGLVLGLTAPVSTAVEEPAANVFRPKGDVWEVSFGGMTIDIRAAQGMAYIAHLLAHPGAEFHVLQLFALCGGQRPAQDPRSGGVAMDATSEGGRAVRPPVRADDALLDETAIKAYRSRLEAVGQELTEAERAGDQERMERLRTEKEWLSAELRRTRGLGGRPRAFPDEGERARKAVTAAIERSRERIRRLHPPLGVHLDQTLKTGYYCSYRCDPPLAWITESR